MGGAISVSCVAPFTAIVGLSWYCRGFEISLQRYNIFGQVVGNVLPIITGGRIFSPDCSGRTRADPSISPLKGGEDPKSPFSGPPKISDFGVSFGRFRGSFSFPL